LELFGMGGGQKTAEAMGVPFLGRIPFDPRMVECADNGKSYLDAYPESDVTKAYDAIVGKIVSAPQKQAAVTR
jgi:nitrogenase subunit NifH